MIATRMEVTPEKAQHLGVLLDHTSVVGAVYSFDFEVSEEVEPIYGAVAAPWAPEIPLLALRD